MTHIDRANLMVLGHHLATLTEVEHKVWQVFHVHANDKTGGLAFPGTTLVARLVGHKDHKRVRKAIDALVTKGFLVLHTAATFRTPTKYLVKVPTSAHALPSQPETAQPPPGPTGEEGAELPPVGQIDPGSDRPPLGQLDPTPGGLIGPPPPGRTGPPNSEWNSEENSAKPRRAGSSKRGKAKAAEAGSADSLSGFERWWAVFPDNDRRINRRQTLAIWERDGLEAMADRIVAHTQACAAGEQWRKEGGRFVPTTVRYLSERRYESNITRTPAPVSPERRIGRSELQAAHELAGRKFDRDFMLGQLTSEALERLAAETRAAMTPTCAVALALEDPRRSETLRWKMYDFSEAQNSAQREATLL